MPRKFLDPTPDFSDPGESGLKVLDGAGPWANPDDKRRALDAAAEWTAPEQVGGGIYGVTFPGFPAVTKGVRTDDAANFGDVHPAVANGTGDSPFDTISPWCDMVPEEREGGTMVPIPKFWYKLTQNGACVDIQIANEETEGFHVSPAHMDRNDGKSERDVVYVGRYHCATDTYKSTSGVLPASDATKATMYAACQQVGAGYYMIDFATRFTIWLLYLVEMAEWNSQSQVGFGVSLRQMPVNMGYTDEMQYCTGTSQSLTTDRLAGTQWRNIEGLWEGANDILSGCYNDSRGFEIITDASKLGSSTGGKSAGIPMHESGNWYAGALTVSDTGGFPLFYGSSSTGGSEDTGTCDSWDSGEKFPVIATGGSFYGGANNGMFQIVCMIDSSANVNHGTRLMELP